MAEESVKNTRVANSHAREEFRLMADIVDKPTRSRMMAGIRGKNTVPELMVRRELHCRGYRFRLHSKGLPGRPDIVLPRYRAVIFVNGCFWHRHGCRLFKWPSTDCKKWRDKLEKNVARDAENREACHKLGWRVLVIWECALKGPDRLGVAEVIDLVERWICASAEFLEIPGRPWGQLANSEGNLELH